MMVDNTCVLVVDDEETVRRHIIEQLEQYSITVVAAKDGLQALRALHERPFDAVITDLSVPYLDGFDLLCQCHLVWPQLPVILMSSSLVDEIVQLAMIEGAAAYLPKPVNTKKLIDILRKVIVRPVSPSETTRIHDRPERSRTTIAKESPSHLLEKGASPMRIIGLIVISVWLGACSATPMFPPAVTKDVEANTFDAKAWEQEAYQASHATFVPHKVELAGEIIRVIQQAERLVILAEERPLDARLASTSMSDQQDDAPWFAITFRGVVEPRMLRTGNRLFVIGTTYRASPEMFGGAPRVLPHLRAQCLHIWDSEGVKNKYWISASGSVQYPPEERTICLEDKPAGASSVERDDNEQKASGGS